MSFRPATQDRVLRVEDPCLQKGMEGGTNYAHTPALIRPQADPGDGEVAGEGVQLRKLL